MRTFLKEYEDNYPEDVIHIDKEVNCNQEITRIVQLLEKQNKFPLLIFSNVLNQEGNKAEQAMVTNVSSSRLRVARIGSSTYETIGLDIYEATRERRRKPVVVHKEEAPVKEVVQEGSQINLLELPAALEKAPP